MGYDSCVAINLVPESVGLFLFCGHEGALDLSQILAIGTFHATVRLVATDLITVFVTDTIHGLPWSDVASDRQAIIAEIRSFC